MAISNKELIDIINRYESVDKSVIYNNIYALFNTHYKFKNEHGSKRIIIIAAITKSAYNTVIAWHNSSRPTKIPMIKLLQIADVFDIPFECFFDENSTWLDEETSERLDKKITELEELYND